MIHTTAQTLEHPLLDASSAASDLDYAQMRYVEALLDGPSTELLWTTRPQPGWRCLEIGAGGGSIARWLEQRTSPGGEVHAVDLDTDLLERIPGVTAHRHDINDGLPVEGPFDLVHARLVLLDLPRRTAILEDLVDALAPGGWLVVGEFSARLPRSIPTDGPRDGDLFDRLMEISHGIVGRGSSRSLAWAQEVAGRLDDLGLVDLQTRKHSPIVTGSDLSARYLRNLATQIRPQLIAAGMTDQELDRCDEILMDPRFRAWFYQLVSTRGRAPSNS